MTFEARKLTGWNPMICQACGPEPACIHVDGNAKLYRYKSAGGAVESERPYLENICIFNKAAVDSHIAETEERSTSQVSVLVFPYAGICFHNGMGWPVNLRPGKKQCFVNGVLFPARGQRKVENNREASSRRFLCADVLAV